MLRQATGRQEKTLLDSPLSEQAPEDRAGPSTRDKRSDDPMAPKQFDDPMTVGVLLVGPMSVDHEQPAELRSSLARGSLADRCASVGYSFCNAGDKKGFVAATPRIEGIADIGEGKGGFVAATPRIEAIPGIDEGDQGFVAATPRIESMADVARILESSREAQHCSNPATHGVYNV